MWAFDSKQGRSTSELTSAAVTDVFYRKLSINIADNNCQSPYVIKTNGKI